MWVTISICGFDFCFVLLGTGSHYRTLARSTWNEYKLVNTDMLLSVLGY